MNIFDEARSIRAMMELPGMTQGKAAQLMGITQSYVANKLRLLDFSDEAQMKITEYGLSSRHARAILRLRDEGMRMDAIERAHKMKMNVSRCEMMVDSMLFNMKKDKLSITPPHESLASFEILIEDAVARLRESGFFARSEREEIGERIYYTISVKR